MQKLLWETVQEDIEYTQTYQYWTLEELLAYEELLDKVIPGKNKITGSQFATRAYYIYNAFKDLDNLIFSKEGAYLIGEGVWVEPNGPTYETAESYQARKLAKPHLKPWIRKDLRFKDETMFLYCYSILEKGLLNILSEFKIGIGLPSIMNTKYNYAAKLLVPNGKEKLEKIVHTDEKLNFDPKNIILDDFKISRVIKHINYTNLQVNILGKYLIVSEEGINVAPIKMLNLFQSIKIQLMNYINSLQKVETILVETINKVMKEPKYARTKEYKDKVYYIESFLMVLESIITHIAIHYCVIKSDLNYHRLSMVQKGT